MDTKELRIILDSHKLWLEGNVKGLRANLRDADLRNAYLGGANLRYADGVTSFSGTSHTAYYLLDRLIIGCCDFPLYIWKCSYKEIGKRHGYSANQIKEYGAWIKSLKGV